MAASLYIDYPQFPMLPLMNVDLSMAVDLARCPLEPSEADLAQLWP